MLERGLIFNTLFQTYESHLDYFMHFYTDCDIYGLNEVEVQNYKFRKNFPAEIMGTFKKFFMKKTVNFMFGKENPYACPFDLI